MATKTSTRPRKTSVSGRVNSAAENNQTVNLVPCEDDIRSLAEVIYHHRIITGENGSAQDDWFKAENYLRSTDN